MWLSKDGAKILNFAEGKVLSFKSQTFNLAPKLAANDPGRCDSTISLSNDNDDILLQIIFRRAQNKIWLDNWASKSIGNGWGEERSVDLNPMDVIRWGKSGVTISVHHYSTGSGFGRYQILFNLTTICHFDKIFPGQATSVQRVDPNSFLDTSLRFYSYKISALRPEERQAILTGITPSPGILSLNSMAMLIQPSCFIPDQTYASISWDQGREIRHYHLGPGNVLQEYAYSESAKMNRLCYGELHKLNIILDPTSSIAAIRHQDGDISIFFQDPMDGFIRILKRSGATGEWQQDPAKVAKAVMGSSIAVATDSDGPVQYRVFYQDFDLHLREHFRVDSSTQWCPGFFNAGIQPRGTPITAEVVHGGDVDINVAWRDETGRFASRSWSKSSGWDLPNKNGEGATLDGQD